MKKLPNGWEIKKLGEVCEKITDGSHFSPKTEDKGMPYITVRDLNNDKIDFQYCKFISKTDYNVLVKNGCNPLKGDVLFSKDGTVGKVSLIDYEKDFVVLSSLAIIRPDKNILDSAYLKYLFKAPFFLYDAIGRKTGVAIKRIVLKNLKEIDIPIPPIQEQKRIVKILDEVFAAIDKAKANAEKNLANSKELFESYLNGIFGNPGDDWEEKRLGDCFKLKSGDGLTSKMMNMNGEYNVYGGNGVAGKHDKYNLDGINVIIGRVGAQCGIARNIKEKIWLTDNAFKLVDLQFSFDLLFLTYLLNFKNLRNLARQTAQPVISNSSLKDLVLIFPKSMDEQNVITKKLEVMKDEINKLEKVYIEKIHSFDELKRSILKKAFEGEL